jgi:hypothetical protein
MNLYRLLGSALAPGPLALRSTAAWSQGTCPEEPAVANWTGAGTVVRPCFVPGEEADAVL